MPGLRRGSRAQGDDRVGWPRGADLARDLVAHGHAWLAAGRPAIEDHAHRFIPIATPPPPVDPGRVAVVTRVDHHQVITLGHDH